MAVKYVKSSATGANNGTSWANAWTSLVSANSGAAAGDTVYVHNTHYEDTSGTLSLNIGTSKTNLVKVISVNDALQATAGAQVRSIVGGTVSVNGKAHYWGIDISGVGYGINTFCGSQDDCIIFENGVYGNSAGSGQRTTIGGYNVGGGECYLVNSTWSCSGDSHLELRTSKLRILGGAATGSRCSGSIFRVGIGYTPGGDIKIDGFDFSGTMSLTAALVSMTTSNIKPAYMEINRCKLASGWTGQLCTDTTLSVVMDSCDDGGSILRSQKWVAGAGNIYTDTAIKRAGGAEVSGIGLSHRMVGASTNQEARPLDGRWLARAYPSTSAEDAAFVAGAEKTVSVEIVTDGAALKDNEVWLEVRSFDTLGSTNASIKRSKRLTPTTTPADQPTSSATWATTGLSSPVKQKLSVSIAPQLKGYITARVVLAKASTTVYVCPKVEIT